MKYKGLYFGFAILVTGYPATTVSAQDGAYYAGHSNSFEHRLYLKIPFAPATIKHSLKKAAYGYSFNYRRSKYQSFVFNSRRRDFTSSLVNINFSPTSGNKINFAGVPLLRFDKFGLYANEESEGAGGTGTAVLAIGGVLGLLALAVATSDEEEEKSCDPATINGNPITIGGITVCKSPDL